MSRSRSRKNKKGGSVFNARKSRNWPGWVTPATVCVFTRLEEAMARDDEAVDLSEFEDYDEIEFAPEDFGPDEAEEPVVEINPEDLDRLLAKP